MVANSFESQVVAITGGSRGIGFETAKAFLAKGEKKLAELGEILAVLADVSNFKQASDFIDKTVKKFGRLDILVNNAGVAGEGNFVNQNLESIDKIIDTKIAIKIIELAGPNPPI